MFSIFKAIILIYIIFKYLFKLLSNKTHLELQHIGLNKSSNI